MGAVTFQLTLLAALAAAAPLLSAPPGPERATQPRSEPEGQWAGPRPPRLDAQRPQAQPWQVESGLSANLEAPEIRWGTALDVGVRYRGWGGRLELGAYLPRINNWPGQAQTSVFSVHGLLLAEGCDQLAEGFRLCAGGGGGAEWIVADGEGEDLVSTRTQTRWTPRFDGLL